MSIQQVISSPSLIQTLPITTTTPAPSSGVVNELLINPQETISKLEWQRKKYNIYAIISLVVFAVLAIVSLYFSFLAGIEAIAFAGILNTMLLTYINSHFFEPWRAKARECQDRIDFEVAVRDNLDQQFILSPAIRASHLQGMMPGDNPAPNLSERELITIMARYYTYSTHAEHARAAAGNCDQEAYNQQQGAYNADNTTLEQAVSLAEPLFETEARRTRARLDAEMHRISALHCLHAIRRGRTYHGSLDQLGAFEQGMDIERYVYARASGRDLPVFRFRNGGFILASASNTDILQAFQQRA